MPDKKDYWFPAKLYGWGWGFPHVWQGWVVWACYVLGISATYYFVPPTIDVFLHAVLVAGLTLMLLIICWLKGEPTRWRWGR